jgi:hypothetical protein
MVARSVGQKLYVVGSTTLMLAIISPIRRTLSPLGTTDFLGRSFARLRLPRSFPKKRAKLKNCIGENG